MGNIVSSTKENVSVTDAAGNVGAYERHSTRHAEDEAGGKGQVSVDDCPVLNRGGAGENRTSSISIQYNVYNQPIDPRNNMPASANQAPFPGQKVLLSTERIQSNIPKGGTESTWVYPSPQMFYNALKVRFALPDAYSGLCNTYRLPCSFDD